MHCIRKWNRILGIWCSPKQRIFLLAFRVENRALLRIVSLSRLQCDVWWNKIEATTSLPFVCTILLRWKWWHLALVSQRVERQYIRHHLYVSAIFKEKYPRSFASDMKPAISLLRTTSNVFPTEEDSRPLPNPSTSRSAYKVWRCVVDSFKHIAYPAVVSRGTVAADQPTLVPNYYKKGRSEHFIFLLRLPHTSTHLLYIRSRTNCSLTLIH